jgi:hypothetical protein
MLGKGLPPPRPPDVEIVLPVAPAHAPCACDPPCAPLSPPLATIWHQLWSAFSERAEGFSAKLDAVLKEAGWTPHPSTFGRTMMPSSAPQDGIDRFSTLAPDILNVILRLAGMSATGSVAATCRTLRIMATDQELWRAHVAHFFRESSDDDDSQEPTVVSLAVEGRSELRRWSRALPEEHVIRLDRFVPIGVRVVCEVTQESAHARLSQQPPPPSFDWRRFCCAICRLRVLSEWHWRLDVLRAAVDSQRSTRTSGGGGPSDLCRALRFASAATHWVATSTQTLLLRRQDEQLASVHGLLPSIAVELEAFTRMGTHEFGTGRVEGMIEGVVEGAVEEDDDATTRPPVAAGDDWEDVDCESFTRMMGSLDTMSSP